MGGYGASGTSVEVTIRLLLGYALARCDDAILMASVVLVCCLLSSSWHEASTTDGFSPAKSRSSRMTGRCGFPTGYGENSGAHTNCWNECCEQNWFCRRWVEVESTKSMCEKAIMLGMELGFIGSTAAQRRARLLPVPTSNKLHEVKAQR